MNSDNIIKIEESKNKETKNILKYKPLKCVRGLLYYPILDLFNDNFSWDILNSVFVILIKHTKKN
jgi:hypothetical protein